MGRRMTHVDIAVPGTKAISRQEIIGRLVEASLDGEGGEKRLRFAGIYDRFDSPVDSGGKEIFRTAKNGKKYMINTETGETSGLGLDIDKANSKKEKKDPKEGATAINNSFDENAEREKILNGEYPSRIVQGRQNKHIPGTREFEQKRESMKRENPKSEPSILTADAKMLVDKYKGTGTVYQHPSSNYPRENVTVDFVIGKTWVKSMKKYVDSNALKILYSNKGVHIFPINTYTLEE